MGKIEQLNNLLVEGSLKRQKVKGKKQKNDKEETINALDLIKQSLTQYAENFTAQSHISKYINDNPESVLML
jgi:hypothetical protein